MEFVVTQAPGGGPTVARPPGGIEQLQSINQLTIEQQGSRTSRSQ